jgi:Flp pilus assembly protein TadD
LVAVSAGAAVAFGLFGSKPGKPPVPKVAAAMMARAESAYREFSPRGNNEAIGLLRRTVEIAPDYADAWGLLSVAYAQAYWGRGNRNDPGMMARGRTAIERARALDPYNAYAALGEVTALPLVGTWLEVQRKLRGAIAHHPDNDLLLQRLAGSFAQVGRLSEAIPLIERAIELSPTVPSFRFMQGMTLWSAGRLDDADKAVEEGLKLFPSEFSLWFARYYIALFSGQTSKAIAQVEEKSGRPVGYDEAEFDRMLLAARAFESRKPADVDAAMAGLLAAAHTAVGHCQIAIQHASAFGRLDTAFAVADALFFGRGFDPGEVLYSAPQGTYSRHNDRRTNFLFYPPVAAMRADPRFAKLNEEIGLTRYWREAGVKPDYRR